MLCTEINTSQPATEDKETLLKLIDIVSIDPQAFEFLEPVDYVGLNILDYPSIVTHPMDLGTVKENILTGKYSAVGEVLSDIDLIWSNCRKYNESSSEICRMALHCEKVFKKNYDKLFRGKIILTKLGRNLNEAEGDNSVVESITMNEKILLGKRIRSLSSEELAHLIKYIVSENPRILEDVDKENLQIKIDLLSKSAYNKMLGVINKYSKDKK